MAKLWDKEITVDEQISLLEDFSSYLEVSMLVTIEKFKSIIILQKMGWLNDARGFLTNTLPEVCNEVGQYLVKSKLMNPPNWKIFLKDRLEIAKEAGQTIYSYHEKCFQICASQYQQQYQATYEQELAKQDGLGFGIISSSLAAHLVYAAQSASKERANEKKASEATDRIMHSSLNPVDKAVQMTIAFYHEKFDPFVNEFLISFYSDIERLIYDGLDVDKETLDNNKVLSCNELSDITEDNRRERITASLSIYPFNGDALFWAVRYDDAEDELIEFCSDNPLLLPKYLVAFEQSAVAYLKKQKEKADLYNRDPLTEDIVQLLQRIRAFLTDERMCGVSTYDNIIQEVYGERIDITCDKFAPLLKIQKNESSLANYAREHKTLNLSQNDFETLQKYNAIFGTTKISDILDSLPSEVESFNRMLSSICEEIKTKYEKHQKSERRRKQREFEKAEQERKAEEVRKAEEQRQKELEKAKAIKKFVIVASVVVAVIVFLYLLTSVIIPNAKYNDAVALMDAGQYEDAIIAFEAMDGYKDSKEQIKNCKTALKDIEYQKADQSYSNRNYETAYSMFMELIGYKDSLDRAKECALYVGGEALVKKNYEKAIEWYTKAGFSEEVKNVKYQYVLAHRNNDDETTFTYLSDLRKANYKDSGAIFSELYSWKIEFVAANSDPNSTQNKTNISKYDPVYIHFVITGGAPNATITPYVTYKLPNGKTGTYEWDYYCKEGDALWYGWSEGIYSDPQYGKEGTLTLTFYPSWYISAYDPIGTITVNIGP